MNTTMAPDRGGVGIRRPLECPQHSVRHRKQERTPHTGLTRFSMETTSNGIRVPEDDATTDINRVTRINANATIRNLALAA